MAQGREGSSGWIWPQLLRLRAGCADPLAALDRAQIDWVLWAPLGLGCGVGVYFLLPFEPGGVVLAAALSVIVLAGLVWLRGPGFLHLPATLFLMASLGLLSASWRAQSVAAPVLPFHYYGPVEGRIVGIDRSARDVIRLTLDQVRLGDLAPEARPARVRIALHGDIAQLAPEPGLRGRCCRTLAV